MGNWELGQQIRVIVEGRDHHKAHRAVAGPRVLDQPPLIRMLIHDARIGDGPM
jgi:hypothetical protein